MMALFMPYTYFQCPCSGSDVSGANEASPAGLDDDDDDDRTFDPRAPRSNYSLHPLEYLLYCEDCHQIRCPRCVAEEIVTYYCPNCLFEWPSSNLKSEGNRCTRNCFQCPICIGPLVVISAETWPHRDANRLAGPFVLACTYCGWCSSEAGLQFDKANGIYAQLQKVRNGGIGVSHSTVTVERGKEVRRDAIQEVDEEEETGGGPRSHKGKNHSDGPSKVHQEEALGIEAHFSQLKSFYQRQLWESNPSHAGPTGLGDLGLSSSPSAISRLMNMYTGVHFKKDKKRIRPMREALNRKEGLQEADLDESALVDRLRTAAVRGTALEETASTEQLANQQPAHLGAPPPHGRSRFASELRPIPHLLRTKRSKRCPVCRHIISKPEAKVQMTHFRIRLVASSYIPSIDIQPLAMGLSPAPHQPSAASPSANNKMLRPLRPAQYLLIFKNPIFESVKVTLATPNVTPGRFPSKVTVLCPTFDIDANTDVWDEALKFHTSLSSSAAATISAPGTVVGPDGQVVAEAGKPYERGRNWVSIVVEVVPASLPSPDNDTDAPREDEDLLEIPMFVRVEWEEGAGVDGDVGEKYKPGTSGGGGDNSKVKRELAYWCVLGMGRISRD